VAKLQLVQDPAADALLESNPFALLVGMLLDQQYPMEAAFAGPKKIADRIGGVDAREIADYNPEEFAALCSKTPAIHRFPGSMAKRIQDLSQIIVDQYGGVMHPGAGQETAQQGRLTAPEKPCNDGDRSCGGAAHTPDSRAAGG